MRLQWVRCEGSKRNAAKLRECSVQVNQRKVATRCETNFSNHQVFHIGTLFQCETRSPQSAIFSPIAWPGNVNMKGREVPPMLNHNSVQANPLADADDTSEIPNPTESRREIYPNEVPLFQTLSRKRDVAPVAYMPKALEANPKARSLRRILTREQGRALEMIGHAVDYLNDCYLYDGADDELITFSGAPNEAIQILVSLRWQILQSAPVREPRRLRLWKALFHRHNDGTPGVVFRRAEDRGSSDQSSSVLPLSSSR